MAFAFLGDENSFCCCRRCSIISPLHTTLRLVVVKGSKLKCQDFTPLRFYDLIPIPRADKARSIIGLKIIITLTVDDKKSGKKMPQLKARKRIKILNKLVTFKSIVEWFAILGWLQWFEEMVPNAIVLAKKPVTKCYLEDSLLSCIYSTSRSTGCPLKLI